MLLLPLTTAARAITSVPVHQTLPGFAAGPSTGGVLLIVPGVADAARARLTLHNIRALKPRACLLFTHRRTAEDAALDEMLDVGAAPLASECDIIRAPNGPGGGYVQHIKRVPPSMVELGGFEWVFVLLDDVDTTGLSLAELARVARHNGLSWVSPSVEYAHDAVMRPTSAAERQALARRLGRGSGAAGGVVVGRLVKRIEAFAWLLSPPMYRCFHALIDPNLNGIGWGYDNWLGLYCQAWPELRPVRAGVVDTMVVLHGARGRSGSQPDQAGSAMNVTPLVSVASTSSASNAVVSTSSASNAVVSTSSSVIDGGVGGVSARVAAATVAGAGDVGGSRSAAAASAMSHTYGRKEAREAASAMVALMGRRGIRLHQVSPEPIGVLYAPPEPQRPASAPFQAAEIESRELPVRADPLGDEIESRISSLEAPLRSPHSLPLACVPPQIWHTALALAPSLLREWWRGCHVTASLKDRGALWEQLRRSGSSCEGSRLVEVIARWLPDDCQVIAR